MTYFVGDKFLIVSVGHYLETGLHRVTIVRYRQGLCNDLCSHENGT